MHFRAHGLLMGVWENISIMSDDGAWLPESKEEWTWNDSHDLCL